MTGLAVLGAVVAAFGRIGGYQTVAAIIANTATTLSVTLTDSQAILAVAQIADFIGTARAV